MMTPAAGTIRPAKVLILGAGIAGLQAIGTARRLGAVVTAYDVRPASRGEVEALGAKFLDLGLDFSKGQGEGGYARQLSAVGLNNFHRFPNRGACGNNIIHQHDAALQRAPHQVSALAVSLRLFAVKAVRQIAVMVFRQRDRRGRGNRNAFIGRAEQQVKINPGIHQRFGVKTA